MELCSASGRGASACECPDHSLWLHSASFKPAVTSLYEADKQRRHADVTQNQMLCVLGSHRSCTSRAVCRCAGGLAFYNAKVALPLGLSTIALRSQSGYYRQAAAVLHDADTIAANAEEFNGPDSMYTRLAKGRLCLLSCMASQQMCTAKQALCAVEGCRWLLHARDQCDCIIVVHALSAPVAGARCDDARCDDARCQESTLLSLSVVSALRPQKQACPYMLSYCLHFASTQKCVARACGIASYAVRWVFSR